MEISVLSLLTPILPAQVRLGVHGLHIRLGAQTGLLLPQVPVEWGWDVPTFLAQTCRKAGLSSDAWTHELAEIYGFTTERFGEP